MQRKTTQTLIEQSTIYESSRSEKIGPMIQIYNLRRIIKCRAENVKRHSKVVCENV